MHWAWTIGEDQPAVDIPSDWVPPGAVVTLHVFDIAQHEQEVPAQVGAFMGILFMDLEPVTDTVAGERP